MFLISSKYYDFKLAGIVTTSTIVLLSCIFFPTLMCFLLHVIFLALCSHECIQVLFYFYFFSADDDADDGSVSSEMMLALHQSNETLANVAAHLENLETLMRLLCHVSFIHHKDFHLFFICMHVWIYISWVIDTRNVVFCIYLCSKICTVTLPLTTHSKLQVVLTTKNTWVFNVFSFVYLFRTPVLLSALFSDLSFISCSQRNNKNHYLGIYVVVCLNQYIYR